MVIIPANRPAAPRDQVARRIEKLLPRGQHFDVVLYGVRGYFRDTMGVPGRNDRGLYDDAMFVFSPTAFVAFNANVDPAISRAGIAMLATGCYLYKRGRHGISRGPGYPALRPASRNEELPVYRDGEKQKPSLRPGVAINIHRGGETRTSSEGCQTIPPSQWQSFISLVYFELERHGQELVPYILEERQG